MKVWAVWYPGLRGPSIHKCYESLPADVSTHKTLEYLQAHNLTEEQAKLSLDELAKIFPPPGDDV